MLDWNPAKRYLIIMGFDYPLFTDNQPFPEIKQCEKYELRFTIYDLRMWSFGFLYQHRNAGTYGVTISLFTDQQPEMRNKAMYHHIRKS